MESQQRRTAKTSQIPGGPPFVDTLEPSLSIFMLFPELPVELRLVIWQLSLPGPRIVVISEASESQYYRGVGKLRVFPPPPVHLYICHESRNVCLELYTILTISVPNPLGNDLYRDADTKACNCIQADDGTLESKWIDSTWVDHALNECASFTQGRCGELRVPFSPTLDTIYFNTYDWRRYHFDHRIVRHIIDIFSYSFGFVNTTEGQEKPFTLPFASTAKMIRAYPSLKTIFIVMNVSGPHKLPSDKKIIECLFCGRTFPARRIYDCRDHLRLHARPESTGLSGAIFDVRAVEELIAQNSNEPRRYIPPTRYLFPDLQMSLVANSRHEHEDGYTTDDWKATSRLVGEFNVAERQRQPFDDLIEEMRQVDPEWTWPDLKARMLVAQPRSTHITETSNDEGR